MRLNPQVKKKYIEQSQKLFRISTVRLNYKPNFKGKVSPDNLERALGLQFNTILVSEGSVTLWFFSGVKAQDSMVLWRSGPSQGLLSKRIMAKSIFVFLHKSLK